MASPILLHHKFSSFNIRKHFTPQKKWFGHALLIVVILIVISVIARFATVENGENFFTFARSNHYGNNGIYLYLLLYSVHSLLQETLIFGLVVSGLIYYFPSFKKYYFVIIVGVAFGIAHYYLGIFSVLVTMFCCFVLGAIYIQDENIWKVSLIHYLVGLFAIAYGWV